jgi:PAS domain S-box-containing protein
MSAEPGRSSDGNLPPNAVHLPPGELRAIIDNAPVAVWSCLPNGDADFLNHRWLAYLNVSAEDAKGAGWASLVHPDDLAGHLRRWSESVSTEGAFEFESRFRRHDGAYRWFLARAEPVRDAAGKIIKWCGTNIDIEDRKQAENALRRNETYLSEAQRLSKTGSFSWNPSSGEMHWSDESFRIFELPPVVVPTVAGMVERTHPDDRAVLLSTFRPAGTPEAFDIRSRLSMPDGRIKHLRIVGRVVAAAESERTYAGAYMDSTEATLADGRLHQAHAALAHVTRVLTLGELAASIAHEVNQPLTGIVSNGEACMRWLDSRIPDLAEVRSCLRQMVADTRRAAEVIHRLRTLARKADPEYIPLDINEVVSETVPLIQREIANHRALLELTLSPELPRSRGDRIQLQQVVINLVINGIQAMTGTRDRPIQLTLHTAPSERGGSVVSVVDAGTGIPPEAINEVFEPFYSTKSDGLGMGLSICRSIIEAHGGEIWASNNPDRGATVSFRVPNAQERGK